jgi:DNA-binding transcriptional MerR regulator/methylmalonyl-CoA mutase cobalamin-binding subunit
MAGIDTTPTFNLKAVIQETGLKPDTLRAWERRYGLPQPERTAGGHRLYSQRDIETLKWLIARQEEGLSISRAIALWRQLESEDRDPLQEPAYAVPETAPVPSFIPDGEAIGELREAWLEACLDFDEHEAEQIVSYALALYPAETVCFEILLRGMEAIGKGWYSGEITVQQEHFVSELTARRLETILASSPPPTRAGRILLGCAPEDQHTLPALVLTFLLKQRGWEAIYLGARVPAERMEATISAIEPHLVALTAQQLVTAATLLDVARLLQEAEVPLAYGGRIFNLLPTLHEYIPGHFLGERLDRAPQMIEHLLTATPALPPAKSATQTQRDALADYRDHRLPIEAEVWRALDRQTIEPDHLSIANEHLARNIEAALQLGNMDFLRSDVSWVEGMLHNHEIPQDQLQRYFKTYLQAARTHLDKRGQPVVAWLAEIVDHV